MNRHFLGKSEGEFLEQVTESRTIKIGSEIFEIADLDILDII